MFDNHSHFHSNSTTPHLNGFCVYQTIASTFFPFLLKLHVIMSTTTTTIPFTYFSSLNFPKKFHIFSKNHCSSSFLSPRFKLYCKLSTGKYYPLIKRRLMGERVIKMSALGSDERDENVSVLEQEAFVDDGSSQISSSFDFLQFEATLNRLSKWLVVVLFGGVLLWRHDAEALWVAMGSILNTMLSVVLKRIINQARPIANMKPDPGMPSSHAQSIFYTLTFVVLSMVEGLGWNEFTAVFAVISLAFASYLSWLRVSQKLHSLDQVAVGAVLGSCFCVAWLWSWNTFVSDAFDSYLWVQVTVVLAAAICCLSFSAYVILYWFRGDQ